MRAAAAVIVLLLAPGVSASWDHYGGGPERSMQIDRLPGPLDVLAVDQVLEDGERFAGHHGMLLAHGDTAVGIIVGSSCALAVFDALPTVAVRRIELDDVYCNQPTPFAMDALTGWLWLCDTGPADAPILQAINVETGERTVALAAATLTGLPPVGPWWTCGTGIIDDRLGRMVVPMFSSTNRLDGFDNALVTVDRIDGTPLGFGRASLSEPGGEPIPGVIQLHTVTAAGERYIVHGRGTFANAGPNAETWQTGAFVFDESLTNIGNHYAMFPSGPLTPQNVREDNWMSSTFAAAGTLVATTFGDEMVLIDTGAQSEVVQRTEAVQAETLGPAERFDMPSAAWGRTGVLLPFTRSVVALDTPDLNVRWTWPGFGPDWRPEQVSPTTVGEILIQVHHRPFAFDRPSDVAVGEAASDASMLLRLGSADGRILQQLPLPLRSEFRHAAAMEGAGGLGLPGLDMASESAAQIPATAIIPAGDWLIGADTWGKVVVLGAADGQLAGVSFETRTPARGEPLSVTVLPDPSFEQIIINWGDGAVDTIDATNDGPTRVHTYLDAGRHDLTVSAVRADGTTATRTFPLDVDGESLNFMQRQFTAGSQDRTWGIIGILLVTIGAGTSLLARRIARRRVTAGLSALAAIRTRAAADELGALSDLQAWHQSQERRLLLGRITEDQFRVLEARGARSLRSIAGRVLRPVIDDLPQGIRRELEDAYRDGFIEPRELEALRESLDAAAVTGEARKTALSLIDAWEAGSQAAA